MTDTPHTSPLPEAPRTAVVTGAGRGIGRGLALGLAAAGYQVALLGRTRTHLEAVAQEIGETTDGDPLAVVATADVTDASAVRDAVTQIEAAFAPAGGVGLLVNNAGVIEEQETDLVHDDVEDVWRVIETNVRGPLLVTHALLPGMLARGVGRVVNLNSGAAHRPSPAYTGYSLSKGALARLTYVLDGQYREQGLRAFDLAPGVVATDMTASMPTWEGRTEWTPVQDSVDLLLGIAAGELDALSGRFVRAGQDTVASLVAHTYDVIVTDARRLRLGTYGTDDPVLA